MTPANGRAPAFTMAERAAALRVAADVMQYSHLARERICYVQLGPNRREALATFVWPGVVRVSLRYTGELVAESQPGMPRVLAQPRAGDPSHNGMSPFEYWADGPVVTRAALAPDESFEEDIPSPLVKAVKQWLNDNERRLVPPECARAAFDANEFCGVRVVDDEGYLQYHLVTEQAMAACVAAQGLPAACAAELNASLAELVCIDRMERHMGWYVVPGLGPRLFYVLNAVYFE